MSDSLIELILTYIEAISTGIELLAAAIIFCAILYGSFRYVRSVWILHECNEHAYLTYKHGLGRSLLLSLEILVAADIIRTVALEQTLESIATLGLLIGIRTFLSWALIVEIEGRWPWQLSQPDVMGGNLNKQQTIIEKSD